MIFYPSKNNNILNREVFTPEAVNGCAMVNPHYPVDLAPGTRYIIDSGAFQELDMLNRVQPWTALKRQLELETQIELRGHHSHAEALVTYDMLCGVDEAIVNGKRVKQRGTETTAAPAVLETLRSAHYYHSQAHRVRGAIAYAAQGASPTQYLGCVADLLPLLRPGRDWLAFGGFCILGRVRSLLPVFAATLALVVPLLAASGIHRAHVLGVCVPEAIAMITEAERRYGVQFSTDSSAPEMCGIMGRTYRNGRQHATYSKAQKYLDYHPAQLAITNIQEYTTWLAQQ